LNSRYFLLTFFAVFLTMNVSYAADKININTADVVTLQQLEGIGEKKAQAIVDYRKQHGLFKELNELSKVNGIGKKTLENNKDRLTLTASSISQTKTQQTNTQPDSTAPTKKPAAKKPVQWTSAKNGAIPKDAFQAGHEAKPAQQPLYICRVQAKTGLHLGKVRPAFKACNFGLEGKEQKSHTYEVLLNHTSFKWLSAKKGDIPKGAIEAGKEKQPLSICRATLHGGIHPGKISKGFQGCKIGWGGKETTVFQYEVLTQSAK